MSNIKITRYLILGLARSGTTAVHFASKGHPNAAALNDEVKASFFTEGISVFTQRDDNLKEKERGYLQLFDSLAGVFANEETTALGMKCVPVSARETTELVKALQQYFPDIKIILVRRNDFAAQYGSMLRAKATGEWHSWSKSAIHSNYRVKINEYRFKKYLFNCVSILSELEALRSTHKVLDVNYEKRFLNDPVLDFRGVFEFLNLTPENITWLNSEKVAPAPESYIENYSRIKKLSENILSVSMHA